MKPVAKYTNDAGTYSVEIDTYNGSEYVKIIKSPGSSHEMWMIIGKSEVPEIIHMLGKLSPDFLVPHHP